MNSINTQWRKAVQRLRRFQPTATDIKGETCHCRRKALMLTYLLPSDKTPHKLSPEDGNPLEPTERWLAHCGYWCTACDFSNAGYRLIEPSEAPPSEL